MKGRILLIDDEDLFREDLARLLREEGFDCRTARDGEEGLRLFEEEPCDLVLCDLTLPGMDGVEVTERITVMEPGLPVILITAYGTLETAVAAFRSGVLDYVLKPAVPEDLIAKVGRAVSHRRLEGEVRYLRKVVSDAGGTEAIVGTHPTIQEVRRAIAKLGPTASAVLISGESGTGKELVARALHAAHQDPDRPFVAVNCAAIPGNLVESELFGHMRGAFTGAVKDKPGLFELASGGTLFLDEIAELPLELQPKLLRVLERGEVLRVGGTRPIACQVRILAATNRDLRREVAEGRFRGDLLYRIRVVEIALPPLRERRADIPLLVAHLLPRSSARLKRQVLGIDHAAMKVLMGAPWPGNIRELENVLERAVILCDADDIGIRDLPAELAVAEHCPEVSGDLRGAVRAFELDHIRKVLELSGGSKEEAAARLGINPSTLYRRLKDLEQ